MEFIMRIYQILVRTVGDASGKVKELASKLPNNSENTNDILKDAMNMLFSVAGLVAIGMIIYSGFMFMRSEGDPNQANKARQSAFWSIVGLVVVIMSAAFANFVIYGVGEWKK